jgi:hypothetical protein
MLHPVVLTVLRLRSPEVRQKAECLGLAFKQESVDGQTQAVRFVFPDLDEADTLKLVNAIPRDVYFFNGQISE